MIERHRRHRRHRILARALAAFVAGLSACETSPVRPDAVPAGRRVEHPHAVTLGAGLAVVWGAVDERGRADIAFSTLDHEGRLAPAVRVNQRAGTAVAGAQVGPRVARTAAGRILVSWVDCGRDPAGDILVARSDDGGATFFAPLRVNDDPGLAGQEYQDLAVLPDGTIALVWLDERDAPPECPNQKEVYFTLSTDGGRTFAPNLALTASATGVCPCCRPAVAASPDGFLHVAYRDREGDALRVRVRSRPPGGPSFSPAIEVAEPGWVYPACPADGPALAALDRGEVLIAWMDAALGRERVRLAWSLDHGRTFLELEALAGLEAEGGGADGADAAPPGRPSLLLDARCGALAAWEDTAGRIWLRAPGARDSAARPAELAAGGNGALASSPVLIAGARGAHLLWTERSLRFLEGLEAEPPRLRHRLVPFLGASQRLPSPSPSLRSTCTAQSAGSEPSRFPSAEASSSTRSRSTRMPAASATNAPAPESSGMTASP